MAEWFDGYIKANGINVHYYRTGGENKPPILLLHGFTDNGLCWTSVVQDLEGSYDVIMTDARGHGRSDGIETGSSQAHMAEDAAGVIRELKLEKPFVYGHSMGAGTATRLAADHPDLVRAVLLEDPGWRDAPPTSERDASSQRPRMFDWVYDLQALSREERIARGRAMNPGWPEVDIIPWADSKAEFNSALLQRTPTPDQPWRELIARISCPILLITGDPELHSIVTPATAHEAEQIWKNGEVLHIEGAGHNVHRDRYEATMPAIRDFLNRH